MLSWQRATESSPAEPQSYSQGTRAVFQLLEEPLKPKSKKKRNFFNSSRDTSITCHWICAVIVSASILVGEISAKSKMFPFFSSQNTCCSVPHLDFIVFWLQLMHKCKKQEHSSCRQHKELLFYAPVISLKPISAGKRGTLELRVVL